MRTGSLPEVNDESVRGCPKFARTGSTNAKPLARGEPLTRKKETRLDYDYCYMPSVTLSYFGIRCSPSVCLCSALSPLLRSSFRDESVRGCAPSVPVIHLKRTPAEPAATPDIATTSNLKSS